MIRITDNKLLIAYLNMKKLIYISLIYISLAILTLKIYLKILRNMAFKCKAMQKLSEMIAKHTDFGSAAQYFIQRFARSNFFDLLKHYRKLTGKWLIVNNVDHL